MAETISQSSATDMSPSSPKLPGRGAKLTIPAAAVNLTSTVTSRLRNQLGLNSPSPVNQNGSFEFDRVIKSGYVQKRTQKTKAWKPVFLVLRPNTLSLYKSDKESKLRHKVYLSELSAATLLKDPKQKRHNLFGLFSPAKNYHFEASTAEDAKDWIELIRRDARIEEEEEEMFLASPIVRRQSYAAVDVLGNSASGAQKETSVEHDRNISSSPEPTDILPPKPLSSSTRRPSHTYESSGFSGNELVSHSDFSDCEAPRPSRSISNSAGQLRPVMGGRNLSQLSGINVENDPDRVVWQGWLQLLKHKRGVRQWKNCWAVLRPRNLILYKDEAEYTAAFIMPLSTVVNTVDIDALAKNKPYCMQIITDEKSYRFSTQDEETLVKCLGAFKSLLSRRRDLEAREARQTATTGSSGGAS